MALFSDGMTLLLQSHDLLQYVTHNDVEMTFTQIAYDSRKVTEDTLFFCKGNFKSEYLLSAKQAGATGYIAEQEYAEGADLKAWIVKDVQKAMALLSAAFFNFPQNQLKIIAYTGTKGKTTSAYFTRGILQVATQGKTALFSTIDRIVGSNAEDQFKSDLSTPESLDLFHDMRRAADNGMTHLVMEVSSQAYKKNRVYGLQFDVGVFLNITPDHIGANEHPTFADYLHCKIQLLVNSKICLINADTDHFSEVYAAATTTTEPANIYLFGGEENVQKLQGIPNFPTVDMTFKNLELSPKGSEIQLTAHTEKTQLMELSNKYHINISGDFNESNATAAVLSAGLVGATVTQAQTGLRNVWVPGRMESLQIPNHGLVYVDYAHNYGSMKALLHFLTHQYKVQKLIVVVGSPGNKGVSRRAGFAKVLNEYADQAFLTTDDPGYEDPMAICQQIDRDIDHGKVKVTIELDRAMAIKEAIKMSQPGDIVVLAAKGSDAFQKINGVDTPYATDMVIAKTLIK